MDSTSQEIDPDRSVELKTTVADGPPIPTFLVSSMLAQETDNDIVVATTQNNVRLTTTTSSTPPTDRETSVLVPSTAGPIETAYPGINLDTRYLTL